MELKELTGVLFQNDFGKTDKSPDVTGEVCVEGSVYKIAGWKNVSSKGKKFMSLKLSFKEHAVSEDFPMSNDPIAKQELEEVF